MASRLTCDVQVRNHVLKRNSELWQNEKGRIAVQTVVLDASAAPAKVAVRRYTKCQSENDVQFAPLKIFEKGTSSVYTAEKVSQEPYIIKAHGVVLVDSSDDHNHDGFHYKRGDKVWLCVACSSKGHEKSVPVTNLRTSKLGEIDVIDVCWYPTHQSDDGRLWTLGGTVQALQLQGGKKQSWSWGVWQTLDSGTAGGLMMKLEDSSSKSKSSEVARKILFEARLQLMENSSTSTPSITQMNDIVPSPLPTPPVSPETKDSQCPDRKKVLQPAQTTIRFTAPCEFKTTAGDAYRANPPRRKRKRQVVETRRKSTLEATTSSSSSTPRRIETPLSITTSKTSNEDFPTTAEDDGDDNQDNASDDEYDASSPRSSTTEIRSPTSPTLRRLSDYPSYSYSPVPRSTGRSVFDNLQSRGSSAIKEKMQMSQVLNPTSIYEICSLGRAPCSDSAKTPNIFPNPRDSPLAHFHLEDYKCTLPAHIQKQQQHRHCVCRQPYPSTDTVGHSHCLLYSRTHPERHTCCTWDKASYPVDVEPFDARIFLPQASLASLTLSPGPSSSSAASTNSGGYASINSSLSGADGSWGGSGSGSGRDSHDTNSMWELNPTYNRSPRGRFDKDEPACGETWVDETQRWVNSGRIGQTEIELGPMGRQNGVRVGEVASGLAVPRAGHQHQHQHQHHHQRTVLGLGRDRVDLGAGSARGRD